MNYLITDCAQNTSFSMDEERLITGCSEGTVKLWSLTSGQEVLNLEKAHDSCDREDGFNGG